MVLTVAELLAGFGSIVKARTLARGAPVMTITVPPLSQFYDKTLIHENKHIEQWNSGMLSDIYRVSTLMPLLLPLTDPTLSGLTQKVETTRNNWLATQDAATRSRKNAAEREAYAISDLIDPRYAYQRCGNYQ
jgi:hypothetical protein